MKKVAALAVAALLTLGLSASEPVAISEQAVTSPSDEPGQDLFARRCAVCHGKTGGGFAEAQAAFPESHRRCFQCHKSGGPEVMVVPFVDNQMFDVGDPPALRGPGTLQALPNKAALQGYIQARMPRHAPGTLSSGEAAALAAFVLELRTTSPHPASPHPAPPLPALPRPAKAP